MHHLPPTLDRPFAGAARPRLRSLLADPTALTLHRARCAAACSQLHGLRGAVEVVNATLSARFFSTLLVLATVGLALAWAGS